MATNKQEAKSKLPKVPKSAEEEKKESKNEVSNTETEVKENTATVTENVTTVADEPVKIGDEIVKGRMRKANIEESIYNLIKKRKKIRFDLSIQRNYVWGERQKSMLIHSILEGYPVPQIFIEASDDDFLWTLDGRQRLTTIFSYHDDDFFLLKDTPPVIVEDEDGKPMMVEIEGKRFSDLDFDLQQTFLNYTISVVEMKNLTTAQREELFQRLNSGSALTKIELTRAQAGEEIMNFIGELAETRFFGKLTSLSDKQRNRFVDQELILQTLALVMGRETGISTKEINEFVKVLRTDEIDTEVRETFTEMTKYLEDALEQFVKVDSKGKEDVKQITKMTKKIHVPMIFLTAIEAKKEGYHPRVFGTWLKGFFDNRYKSGVGSYGSHTQSGSAKATSVKARIRAMKEDFDTHIGEAVNSTTI